MEKRITKMPGETITIFAYAININSLSVYKLTENSNVITDITTPTDIISIGENISKANITLPSETCIVVCIFNNQPLFIRVGNPMLRYCVYTGIESQLIPYERITLAGDIIETANLTEYGFGIYGHILNDLNDKNGANYAIIKSNNNIIKYNKISSNQNSDGISASKELFLDTGFSTYGFNGNKYSYFDVNKGIWIKSETITAKASDLAKAIAYKYNLEWNDRTASNHIYNYIKYLRTYDEEAGVFRFYAPSVTPENNPANFELIITDELGNTFVKGISMLLEQDLETIAEGSSGVIIPFK